MAREFNFGAEVQAAGGIVFKNPEVGDHEAVISAIIHVGSFQDVFTKGNTKEVKKPSNVVLLQTTLMGPEDKNEDDSRMEQWMAIPLKSGDKATLTKLLTAVDPKELLAGFDDFIGQPMMVGMVGDEKKGKNDDGTFKYVNWKTFAGCAGRMKDMVLADVASEGLTFTGHITFDKITKEVLDGIPAHLVRQYFLNEGFNADAKNLSVAGSHVEIIIAEARAADPEWKKKRKDEKEEATPDNRQGLDTGASVPASVPEVQNVPAPEMDDSQEY